MTAHEKLKLAVQNHQAGRLADAEALYRQVLAEEPGNIEAVTNLGMTLSQRGARDQAVVAFAQAVSLRPDLGEAHSNLGNALCEAGRWDAALPVLRRAVELRPELAAAHANLGNALYRSGNLDESTARYQRALELAPTSVRILNNLAIVLRERQRPDESIACCRKALQLQPNDPESYKNFGNVLLAKGELDQAESAYRQALALRPNDPDILANLAHVSFFKGDLDKAAAAYREVLAQQSNHPQAHWSLALVLLTQGNYEEGWKHYEWRWRVQELRQRERTDAPRWDGGELHGKTILIYNEQGFGDTIQFLRYLPQVAGRGGKIVLACQKELLSLLQTFPHVQLCLPADKPAKEIDLCCPLQSLPGIFATQSDNIPAQVPYITAPPDKTAAWRQRLGSETRKTIGLCWSGRPTHPNDRNRSLVLSTLAPLGQLPGLRFISLQTGEAARQTSGAPMELTNWTAELKDFADTAGLIENLDLVISVDTATAHLAGAMGKPTWLLLPAAPDWRWMLNRTDSPWYPTVRLFRQEKRGDWNAPVGRIVEALRSV